MEAGLTIFCMYAVCCRFSAGYISYTSRWRQVTVFMNKSLTHWLNWFKQNTDSLTIQTKSVFIIESLSPSLDWYVQNSDSFKNETSDGLYGCNIDSFTHLIRSNHWFIQDSNKRLSIWLSHWITPSTDMFKTVIHSWIKQVTVFMGATLNYSLYRFI